MNNEDNLEKTIENNLPQIDEAKIADALESYGIPFFYKEPTIVYDKGDNKLIYPAFSLPSYGAVIDYAKDSYGEKYKYQKQLYEINQMPSIIVTPDYLKNPTWQRQLYDQLNNITGQSSSYQNQGLYK